MTSHVVRGTVSIEVACVPCQGTGRMVTFGPSLSHTFDDPVHGPITICSADYSTSRTCTDCGGKGKVWRVVGGVDRPA